MKKCGQCGKPSVTKVNGVPLCVDCYKILMEAEALRQRAAVDALDVLHRSDNQLLGMMETVAGVSPGLFPRYEIQPPTPVVNAGPVTHNISIKDNVIGVLNTGTIDHLSASVGSISASGHGDLASALKEFIETVANDEAIDDDDKRELLEDVDVIVGEVLVSPERRRLGLVKTAVKRIAELAAGIAVIGTAWDTLEPLVMQVLGLL